jgi:hypothetical protein
VVGRSAGPSKSVGRVRRTLVCVFPVALAVLLVAAPAQAWVRTLSCCRSERTIELCRADLEAAFTRSGDLDLLPSIDLAHWFGWPEVHVPGATCTSAQFGGIASCDCDEGPLPLTWHTFSCLPDPTGFVPDPVCAVSVPETSREDTQCWSEAIGYQRGCAVGEEPRRGSGATACITWFLNEQGLALRPPPAEGSADAPSPDPPDDDPRAIPIDRLQEVLQRSFDTWNDVDCAQVRTIFGGRTSSRQVGTRQGLPDFQNTMLFYREGWPHPPLVQGLTSVTYDSRGQIVDADIELNGQSYRLGIVEDPELDRGILDIENTMTHEVGHMLGLDHSMFENFLGNDTSGCAGSAQGTSGGIDCAAIRPDQTTMFATARPGETFKRTLHPDDEAGLCAAYPADGPPMRCELDPERPVGVVPVQRGCAGCATAPATTAPWGTLLWSLLVAGAFGFPVRRRRRARPNARVGIVALLSLGTIVAAPDAHAWWDFGDAEGICRIETHRDEDPTATSVWRYQWEAGRLVEQRLETAEPGFDGLRVRWERDRHGRPERFVVIAGDGSEGRTLRVLWPARVGAAPEAGVWDLNGDGTVDLVERWQFDSAGRPIDVRLQRVPEGREARSAADATETVRRYRMLWTADGRLRQEIVEDPAGDVVGIWERAPDPLAPEIVVETIRAARDAAPILVAQHVPDGRPGCVRVYWDADGDGTTDWIERQCRDASGELLDGTAHPAPDASRQQHVRRREDGAAHSVLGGPWAGWYRLERMAGQPAWQQQSVRDAQGGLLSWTLDRDGDGTIDERRTVVRGCGPE